MIAYLLFFNDCGAMQAQDQAISISLSVRSILTFVGIDWQSMYNLGFGLPEVQGIS
jgi:hypothetical protein